MTETIYWTDSEGGQVDLTDGTVYNVLQGVDGRFMPPFDFITDEHYLTPGDLLKQTKVKARTITLPIIIRGTTESDLRTNERFLMDAFDPTQGEGQLKVVTPDSKTLLLNCHLTDMDFSETTDTGGCYWRKMVAVFLAHDPHWFNALENVKTVYGATYLENMQIVDNDSDVNTWPIWEINGAAGAGVTDIKCENYTSGFFNYWQLSGLTAMTATDIMVIDTRPRTRSNIRANRSILMNNTLNCFSKLTTTSYLFPLVPGQNQIKFTIAGDDATSWWRCRWVDKYNGV